MKIDWIKSLIVVCITALMAYCIYEFSNEGCNKIVLSAGTFLSMTVTSIFSFGVNLNEPRVSVMFKTHSMIWLFFTIVENVAFSFFSFSIPLYVIISGMLILLYAIITVSIYRKQL